MRQLREMGRIHIPSQETPAFFQDSLRYRGNRTHSSPCVFTFLYFPFLYFTLWIIAYINRVNVYKNQVIACRNVNEQNFPRDQDLLFSRGRREKSLLYPPRSENPVFVEYVGIEEIHLYRLLSNLGHCALADTNFIGHQKRLVLCPPHVKPVVSIDRT